MSRTNRNATTKPVLSREDVDRLAERLAIILEHDTTNISLLVLLIDHFARTREDFIAFNDAEFTVKQRLFAGTSAFEKAQAQFESKAMAARGRLLQFPNEKTA